MILNERAYTHMSLRSQQIAHTKDSSIDDYNTTRYYKNKLFCDSNLCDVGMKCYTVLDGFYFLSKIM